MVKILVVFGTWPADKNNQNRHMCGVVNVKFNTLDTLEKQQMMLNGCVNGLGFSTFISYLNSYPGISDPTQCSLSELATALNSKDPETFYRLASFGYYVNKKKYDGEEDYNNDVSLAGKFLQLIYKAASEQELFIAPRFHDMDQYNIMDNFLYADMWICSDWEWD